MAGSGTNKKAKNIQCGPAVILVRPQLGENIGAVARAMANFGLSELRIVAPRDGWPNEAALSMSAGAAYIIESAVIFETLPQALHGLNHVVCTSARPHEQIKDVFIPSKAMVHLHTLEQQNLKTGIMLGPERSGLENEDISYANSIVTIPTNPAYSSLNLGQAMVILGYEWFCASQNELLQAPAPTHPPAQREELFSLMQFFETELTRVGFFRPEHKAPTMARNMRNILHRLELNAQDVKTFYGALQALVKGPIQKK